MEWQIIRGLNADLAQFKEQFTKTQSELAVTLQKLRATERLTNQLAFERDQLRTAITNWSSAVVTRNERLKEANGEMNRLANELNAAIRKFNDLATNYNAVVKDLNDLRARMSQSQTGDPAQPAGKPESQRPRGAGHFEAFDRHRVAAKQGHGLSFCCHGGGRNRIP